MNAVPEHHRHVNHFPSTAPYALSECLADLLDLAGADTRILLFPERTPRRCLHSRESVGGSAF